MPIEISYADTRVKPERSSIDFDYQVEPETITVKGQAFTALFQTFTMDDQVYDFEADDTYDTMVEGHLVKEVSSGTVSIMTDAIVMEPMETREDPVDFMNLPGYEHLGWAFTLRVPAGAADTGACQITIVRHLPKEEKSDA